jgi:hypothetical protein
MSLTLLLPLLILILLLLLLSFCLSHNILTSEDWVLLGCDATSLTYRFLTFRRNTVNLSSRICRSKKTSTTSSS